MLTAVFTGLAAAFLSMARLWLGNPSAPTEVLWAEDGLFPLCIHKADAWTCLTDPFAGYLLFLPRVLAWPVSWLPWEYWATATNVLAAVLVGLTALVAVRVMRRAGMSGFVAVAVGLLPALAPMVGLEAINALGSSYMLLLFLSTLVIAFPSGPHPSRVALWSTALLLLVTALTIPSAVVLLFLVAVMSLRKAVSRTQGLIWIGTLVLGLAAQLMVAISAQTPRPVDFSGATVTAWADAVPTSILTYWPGLSLGEYSFFTNFTLQPLWFTGWLVVALLAVTGLWLCIRGRDSRLGIGVLVVAGLGLGLIPTAIGYANNRYFVVPLLLWGAALLVSLDPIIRRSRPWVIAVVTASVLLVWWPAFPASDFRSTPAPEWSSETARIEAKCVADPGFVDRPLFTPFWPPNWGDGLTEPTHPNLPCTVAWRWIDG